MCAMPARISQPEILARHRLTCGKQFGLHGREAVNWTFAIPRILKGALWLTPRTTAIPASTSGSRSRERLAPLALRTTRRTRLATLFTWTPRGGGRGGRHSLLVVW